MKKTDKIESGLLLDNLQTEGMSAMRPLYMQYRDEYLAFSMRYSKNRDIRLQSFHDAIIQFYEALLSGSYDSKKSSMKTFLFNLGKYRLINRLKKEQTVSRHIILDNAQDAGFLTEEAEWENPKTDELKLALANLGERCKTLLVHIYYESLPTNTVMQLMGYDSENVLYSSKSRCLKKLKELIQENREPSK